MERELSTVVSSDIWFEVMAKKQSLSPQEQMWLRTGYESQFVGQLTNSLTLKSNLEHYFEIKYNIKSHQLISKNREARISNPRQMIMHCLVRYSDTSKTQAGKYYNRDHSTCINAEKRVDNLLDTESAFRIKYLDMLHWVGLGTAATRLRKRYA